jgi:hypothetical protein
VGRIRRDANENEQVTAVGYGDDVLHFERSWLVFWDLVTSRTQVRRTENGKEYRGKRRATTGYAGTIESGFFDIVKDFDASEAVSELPEGIVAAEGDSGGPLLLEDGTVVGLMSRGGFRNPSGWTARGISDFARLDTPDHAAFIASALR